MKSPSLFCALLTLSFLPIQADDGSPTNQPPASTNAPDAAATAPEDTVAGWLPDWRAEKDPAKRRTIAFQFFRQTVESENNLTDDPLNQAAEAEIVRNGVPIHELKASPSPTVMQMSDLISLRQAVPDMSSYVFRRITSDRVEAWNDSEGWLFDQKGNLLVDAKVPRHQGTGHEWYGAFLSDGQWITTDLDSDDQQLTSFSKEGKKLWVLECQSIIAKLPNPLWAGLSSGVASDIHRSVGWARADRTGKRWLVCLGLDDARGFALINPSKKIEPLPADANVWAQVYPSTLGPKGDLTGAFILNGDGKKVLTQGSPAHGSWCGWTNYTFCDANRVTFPDPRDYETFGDILINGGSHNFGFWPHSNAIYLETRRDIYNQEPTAKVWFFDDTGKYEGEINGSYLGNAGNDHDLLVVDAQGQVVRVSRGEHGVSVVNSSIVHWTDGTTVFPVALYPDLALGFFCHAVDGKMPDPSKVTPEIAFAKLGTGPK